MAEVLGDYLYINDEEFVHCQMDFSSENLKNKATTQSGHSDITVIRKDKLTMNISFRGFPADVARVYDLTQLDTVTLSFINPAKGVREERTCEMYGFSYSRVDKSEWLDSIANNLGLYDISFTVEEI